MSGGISYFPNQIFKKLLSILEEKQDDSKMCRDVSLCDVKFWF